MPVIWRDQMSVANDNIDRDHRYLICLFNSIEMSMNRDDRLELLPAFFQQLLDYTKYHFEREEKIQLKMQFSDYMNHKMEHQRIIENLEQVNGQLQKCVGGDVGSLDAAFNKEVLALAREWIIDHLLKTDRELQPLLKKLPPDFQ